MFCFHRNILSQPNFHSFRRPWAMPSLGRAQTHHLSIILNILVVRAKKLTRNGDPYPFYDDGAIREGEGTFLSNTQKIYMAEWHAVASLVFGITIPFIVVEWSEPKAKKSAYSC